MTPKTRMPAKYARTYPGVIMKVSRTLVSPTSISSSGSLLDTKLFTMGASRSARSRAAAKQTAVKATDSPMYFHRMPGREGHGFADVLPQDAGSIGPQKPPGGHFLGPFARERQAQVHIVEDGRQQEQQDDDGQ